MKILKKIQLINWHYFAFQEIDLDQINFLTGKNASGKTTIIDAIQLVILGDTTGRFFNKSATDKSNRSLTGYLRCEFGDNDDGSIIYLRNGKFSSYIVLEFSDDQDGDFCVGIVFDSYSDGSYNYKFFYFNGIMPANRFVNKKVPLNQKELRPFLLTNYSDVKFFETNTAYREFCKNLFGGLNNNYFSLFKKAIPFSPITNIEQFITEYVCDVKNTIDITAMQENIRDYKRLEIEAQEIEKRIAKLSQIKEIYHSWKTDYDKVSMQRYILNRGELYLANKNLEKFQDTISDLNNEIEDKTRILGECEAQISTLKKERDSLIKEKFSSDVFKQKAVYDEKLTAVNETITKLENSVSKLQDSLAHYVFIWTNAAKELLNHRTALSEALIIATNKFIKELALNAKEKTISTSFLNNFQKQVVDYLTILSNEGFKVRSTKFELESQLTTLSNEIEVLKSGKKAYNPTLLKFKEVMEENLAKENGKHIEVNFLADLMDIKDDSWRMVIEKYLFTQRFYLIVEPEYVDSAIAIYDRLKKQYHFSEFGILDTEKIAKLEVASQPNSIVEEIITNNEVVKKYITNLMGSLIKCERIENIRKQTRSITRSGMLYQGYVARQMNLANTTPFIGSKSATDQLKYKIEIYTNSQVEYQEQKSIATLLDSFNHLESFNTNEIAQAELVLNSASVLPRLHGQKEELTALLASFNDNYLESVEKGIAKCEQDIIDLETEKVGLNKEIIEHNLALKTINEEKIPSANLAVTKCKDIIKHQFERNWIIEVGEPAFMQASLENKDLGVYLQNIRNSIGSITSRISSKWSSLIELRIKYNTEYNLNNDANAVDNNYYSAQYDDLNNTKLVEYKSKIIAAKENAMNQFKNDFLAKLKSNFDTVINQIDNLNDALESSYFGDDKYHFIVTPRTEYKKYYEMINDPMLLTGHDITSTAFQVKYSEVIEDLFRQITFVDMSLENDVRSELEKNISKFTDYRSYLFFDLIVTNKYGNKLSLSRNLLKKSGGETQTPFYISVLASFAQAYRVKIANGKFNSIRLIIFDEAFSKMDSERISESIKLLRQFGLQAIVSAPPEKMSDITGLADKTICVVRNNTVSIVTEFKDNSKKV